MSSNSTGSSITLTSITTTGPLTATVGSPSGASIGGSITAAPVPLRITTTTR